VAKVVTTLMGANEALKVGGSLCVSAIVDNHRTAGGRIVDGLGKVPPWVTDVRAINLLDRLTLLSLAVNTNASRGGWCAKQQQCRQENGKPTKATAYLLPFVHWATPTRRA
jgi:hypothetical protein